MHIRKKPTKLQLNGVLKKHPPHNSRKQAKHNTALHQQCRQYIGLLYWSQTHKKSLTWNSDTQNAQPTLWRGEVSHSSPTWMQGCTWYTGGKQCMDECRSRRSRSLGIGSLSTSDIIFPGSWLLKIWMGQFSQGKTCTWEAFQSYILWFIKGTSQTDRGCWEVERGAPIC